MCEGVDKRKGAEARMKWIRESKKIPPIEGPKILKALLKEKEKKEQEKENKRKEGK